MVLDYPFVWPLWNAAENSQRQVCKQSLTLSESTTRDGRCSAMDTPQEALRPTSCGELIRGRYYPQIAARKADASLLFNGPGDNETIGDAHRNEIKSSKIEKIYSEFL